MHAIAAFSPINAVAAPSAKPAARQIGSKAVGLFNLGETNATVTANWYDLKLSGNHLVRDLWRQKDLGKFSGKFELNVAPHGAELVKIQK